MLLILIIILNEAKANIARHAIAALAVVLRGLPLTTEAELARLAMVEALAEIYDLVDGSGIFMTQAASDRVFELANEFLILYNLVCQHSLETGVGAYIFVTKHICLSYRILREIPEPAVHVVLWLREFCRPSAGDC